MADITLSDGREITFDFKQLSLREYRALFDPKQPRETEDNTISRVCGITVDEYLDLSLEDSKRMVSAMIKRSQKPVGADPN
jgi:hypothetical protein